MKNKFKNEELHHMIVKLNYGSNEIFDAMNIAEKKG